MSYTNDVTSCTCERLQHTWVALLRRLFSSFVVRTDGRTGKTRNVADSKVVLTADAVVRRGSGHVPDGRQFCRGCVVNGAWRQCTVHRDDVDDQSQLHRRLHDIVVCRCRTVRPRRAASHIEPDLQQRPTHRLSLQSHRHARLSDDQLPRPTTQEMARRHQTKAG